MFTYDIQFKLLSVFNNNFRAKCHLVLYQNNPNLADHLK